MREADEAASIHPLQRATRFRDGLIIALLAARPLRRKNLCALRLGHHLARRGAIFWIGIPGEETKNGRPIEVPLPEELSRAMDRYLREYRPVLTQGRSLDCLWVSSRAKPMHEVSVYCQVRRITKETFGAPINPHLFRDAAATTLAIEDPEHVRIASQMLGHGSVRVTERHYNQARMLEAARRYQEEVRARRRGLRAEGFAVPPRRQARRRRRPDTLRPAMRAVIYARYSTENQREASIEDQLEVCRRLIAREGWTLLRTYTDAAISGASRFRPGLQQLRCDAERGAFDVIVCEALDRIGRKLADVAELHDLLSYLGVKLVTLATGEVTALHIGMLGTLAQLTLADLREKTRRGQLGRALQGKIPGGRAYGYDVIDTRTKDGRGERAINPAEADVEVGSSRHSPTARARGRSPNG